MSTHQQKTPTVRAEGIKTELADSIHNHFNAIITCPQCMRVGINGTFRKSNAGNINSKGQRYRRFVCKCGELLNSNENESRTRMSCTKTLSTTDFIKHCRQLPSIGDKIIDEIQNEILRKPEDIFQPIGFSQSKKRLGGETKDLHPRRKRRNMDSLVPSTFLTGNTELEQPASAPDQYELKILRTEIVNIQSQLQRLLQKVEALEMKNVDINFRQSQTDGMTTGN